MKLSIPAYKELEVNKLVFDYNGTLACDGQSNKKIKESLNELAMDFEVYILTADTFGTVKEEFDDTEIEIVIIDSEAGASFKKKFVKQLEASEVIAIGNGNNDALMLKEAALGILVLGAEGAASKALLNSDLVVRSIENCLEIFQHPKRLIASLRC
ncbi:HAD family hydrolase [Fuchsiella alkaliacetigena]|uniref:HAD family hydrolase n=1 Tax=Fuchsiella alkaliacetigena TaxID=957042 RepID=UPI002009DDE5|nr:haloacid dehalogenase [Fuchsiella alkaliacetigena]MCK8823969.1 haloacid dehalogenase [Fuchsiella alkaliacetigena]